MTIGDAVGQYLEQLDVLPNTRQTYSYSLASFVKFAGESGVREVEDIGPDLMGQYITYLRDRYAPSTVAAAYGQFEAFARWAGVLPTQPGRQPSKRAPLSVGDYAAMLEAAAEFKHAQRDRAILAVLAGTGVRKQELEALDVGDVNLMDNTLLVRGRSRRTIPLTPSVTAPLKCHLWPGEGNTPDTPLWPTDTGQRLSGSGLRQVIRRTADAAGVPEPGFNAFRLAYADSLLRAAVPLAEVSSRLGYTNVSTAIKYLGG